MIHPELPPYEDRKHGVEFMHEGKHYVLANDEIANGALNCDLCPWADKPCGGELGGRPCGPGIRDLFILPFTDWQLVQLAN